MLKIRIEYIAKNHGLKNSTVALLAEVIPNTSDLYSTIDGMTDMEGYGWDKGKRGKNLRDMTYESKGMDKLVSENPDKFGYDY